MAIKKKEESLQSGNSISKNLISTIFPIHFFWKFPLFLLLLFFLSLPPPSPTLRALSLSHHFHSAAEPAPTVSRQCQDAKARVPPSHRCCTFRIYRRSRLLRPPPLDVSSVKPSFYFFFFGFAAQDARAHTHTKEKRREKKKKERKKREVPVPTVNPFSFFHPENFLFFAKVVSSLYSFLSPSPPLFPCNTTTSLCAPRFFLFSFFFFYFIEEKGKPERGGFSPRAEHTHTYEYSPCGFAVGGIFEKL
jgi:hypothetical protein